MKIPFACLMISLLAASPQGNAASTGVNGRHVNFDDAGEKYNWVPVILTDEEKALLKQRSDPPQTALDYYLLLEGNYFGNVSNEMARRITFIDRATLSDRYLHAEYTIPRTDAGSFSITIRLFEGEEGSFVAISHQEGRKAVYIATTNGPGLQAVSLNMPQFWRHQRGVDTGSDALVRIPDSVIPEISVDSVLSRYRNHYKAHLNFPTQGKTIALTYELPRDGNLIQVTGRENFMDPGKRYVWAEFIREGNHFVPSAGSDEAPR